MSAERTTATDSASVAAGVPTHQGLRWLAHASVEKWDQDATRWVRNKTGLMSPKSADFKRLKVKSLETAESPGNLLTTVGLQRITNLIIGSGAQAATLTATRLGVANGAGTAAVGDVDLSPASHVSTNQWYNILDQTPTAVNGVLTFHSTFGISDGNFAWTEWGLAIGTPTVASGATIGSDVLLNHKTSAALGTKASGSSWALTVTITLS